MTLIQIWYHSSYGFFDHAATKTIPGFNAGKIAYIHFFVK